MRLHIDNMRCGGCARGVTAAIRSVDSDVNVDDALNTPSAEIESTEPRETFLPTHEQIGFPTVET